MKERGSAAILMLAGLAGGCTMIVELSAVRLLAPWFGTSTAVWTNVIGVVLLALSVGYLGGARLSRHPNPVPRLGWVLVLAGLFTLALPALASKVCGLFLPAGVALDQSAALFTWGSLAASLLLFAPTACVLGCVGPLATEALQTKGEEHAGAAGGRVLAVSTLGSLAGTFATTHYFVPKLGLSATFLATGGVLSLLGALTLFSNRRKLSAALVLPLLAIGLAFSRVSKPSVGPEVRLLASVESKLQSLRVVETGSGATLRRSLQINEGLDSFQSVWQPKPGLFDEGYYYNYFNLPLSWNRVSEARVFVVGFGAGTVFRVLEAPAGTAVRLTGVEIDPAVLELGHEWMDLPREHPSLELLSGLDGRAALRTIAEPQQLIILDAYANQTEIPAHLSSVEFFREVRSHLDSAGFLAINVGGFGFDDPVVQAVAKTVARAFERRCLAVLVPSSRNVMLFTGRDVEVPDPAKKSWEFDGPHFEQLAAPVTLPGTYQWFDAATDAELLTDDQNPIERLQERSLERGIRGWLAP